MVRKNDGSSLAGGMRGRLVRSSQPPWIDPMLASPGGKLFFDPDWIYEPKLDGVRCLAHKRGRDVKLYSRNRNIINDRYPEISEALREQPADAFILDGELVACEGNRSSFSLLQSRFRVSDPAVASDTGIKTYYYVFDILYFEVYDLTRFPLLGRKELLEKAVSYTDTIRYLSRIPEADEEYFLEACRKGREGLIAKRADSLYISRRSSDWLKFKCVREQEFVIGGYTEPKGTRTGFGALLLGYYEGRSLRYAGKVGTGFGESTLKDLYRRLSGIEQDRSPFDDDPDERHVHWVRPELIAQVGFAEWTQDGRLRHARFKGFRTDKEPGEVIKEISPDDDR
jgi:bifunctional non-homologous end joining protein LigD